MKTKNFTTTFSISMLNWLDQVAEETKQSKKALIEDALSLWKKEYIKQKIRQSYKNASKDIEWVELSNIGIGDWENHLKKWEV
jgi:predicted transcriptional regulator